MELNDTPLQAADTAVRPLLIWSPADLYRMPEQPVPFLVDDLLPSIGTSIVGASPKAGKSVLTRQLCAFVSQGNPFLGRNVQQGRVMYISTQEQPTKIAAHFRSLGCDEESMPIVVAGNWINPDTALDRVDATIAQFTGLRLVVVDMIADILPLKDTNDYQEMNRKFAPLRYLAKKYQLHLCVSHHIRGCFINIA